MLDVEAIQTYYGESHILHGVSVRVSICNYENLLSSALKRAIAQGIIPGPRMIVVTQQARSLMVEPERLHGLRYDDEFVKHKILDAIGDLVLVGHHVAHVDAHAELHPP